MASIREIARLAHVSPSTVSRVLNQDPKFQVKEATRQKIFQIAAQMKYHSQGQILRTAGMILQQSHIIVLLTQQDEDDLYFQTIDEGIRQEATKFQLAIDTWVSFPRDHFDFQQLRQYSAVIVIGTFTRRFLKQVYFQNQHLVIIDDYRYYQNYDLVRNNYQQETNRVLDLLYQRGNKHLVFMGGVVAPMGITGVQGPEEPDYRTTAYENWMRIHQLRPRVYETRWTEQEGYQAMRQLLSSGVPIDAMILASDKLARGAFSALNEAGTHVPADLKLISFDNSAQAIELGLSSVQPNSVEMGKFAIRLIVQRLIEHRSTAAQVILPAKLIERQSSQ
ncbi:LacI family DNA-binding transcriptional regulator [uncultured Limosilactobacillus sp.]|uniref:LacI family DNA-binding transcriptional regulator n=1 Tax=uncultured Limosilactobacillus sp. TaxID=2837629 RepID=UPI0025E5E8B8|nr:LacI family DNA-binding transcriptional regulator [uncultured Limosilactobacillus sp.]